MRGREPCRRPAAPLQPVDPTAALDTSAQSTSMGCTGWLQGTAPPASPTSPPVLCISPAPTAPAPPLNQSPLGHQGSEKPQCCTSHPGRAQQSRLQQRGDEAVTNTDPGRARLPGGGHTRMGRFCCTSTTTSHVLARAESWDHPSRWPRARCLHPAGRQIRLSLRRSPADGAGEMPGG